jgi:hypothetical protein
MRCHSRASTQTPCPIHGVGRHLSRFPWSRLSIAILKATTVDGCCVVRIYGMCISCLQGGVQFDTSGTTPNLQLRLSSNRSGAAYLYGAARFDRGGNSTGIEIILSKTMQRQVVWSLLPSDASARHGPSYCGPPCRYSNKQTTTHSDCRPWTLDLAEGSINLFDESTVTPSPTRKITMKIPIP